MDHASRGDRNLLSSPFVAYSRPPCRNDISLTRIIAKISENHLNLVALSSLDTADFVSPLLKIISYREVFLSHVHMLYKRMRTQKRVEGAKGAMASGGGTATDVHTTRTSKHNFTSPESCVTDRLDVVEGVRFCNVDRPSAAGLHKNDTRCDDCNV